MEENLYLLINGNYTESDITNDQLHTRTHRWSLLWLDKQWRQKASTMQSKQNIFFSFLVECLWTEQGLKKSHFNIGINHGGPISLSSPLTCITTAKIWSRKRLMSGNKDHNFYNKYHVQHLATDICLNYMTQYQCKKINIKSSRSKL